MKLASALLLHVYTRLYGPRVTYNQVDDFYGYLAYNVELYSELPNAGIEGTGDLYELLCEEKELKTK